MRVLAHRGWWSTTEEKNSLGAFERAFKLGVGVETDLRDHNGRIVIAHDLPVSEEISLEDFLACYSAADRRLPLALNIKADGLEKELQQVLQTCPGLEYFVFDMSLPATLGYRQAKMPFFTRQSEYEPDPLLYESASGVWVDCFEHDWYEEQLLAEHLANGKQLCLVSPELHGRDYLSFWALLKRMKFIDNPQLLLCSDYPQQALEFFHG